MKYEGIIRAIARLSAEGRTETAKRHLKRAWKRYDDMTAVEQEVIEAQRADLYGYSKHVIYCDTAGDYYEDQILARQEDDI